MCNSKINTLFVLFAVKYWEFAFMPMQRSMPEAHASRVEKSLWFHWFCDSSVANSTTGRIDSVNKPADNLSEGEDCDPK